MPGEGCVQFTTRRFPQTKWQVEERLDVLTCSGDDVTSCAKKQPTRTGNGEATQMKSEETKLLDFR